ncbi:hypothetical protein [Candidatus Chloroploca mongolica]|nr:hypothetical protein [Candidatus Chloroploca mongolica]
MVTMLENLSTIFFWILVAMGVALIIAVVGLALMWHQIKALRVPYHAGFFTTLQYVPLSLVILLDLLDFALDIFAAPISWITLDRLGLRGLRNKAALEALIPFTQPIPTFTIAWIATRLLDLDDTVVPQFIAGDDRSHG